MARATRPVCQAIIYAHWMGSTGFTCPIRLERRKKLLDISLLLIKINI
jgi:hypothetical protein